MTPEELRSVTFEKTMRGYRCEDVDDLLEQAARSLEKAMAAKAEAEAESQTRKDKMIVLAQKVEELRGRLENYENEEETLKSALLNAQRMGDNVIREARQKADLIQREAAIKADDTLQHSREELEENQQELIRIKSEVARFKNEVLGLYKTHLELLTSSKILEELDQEAENQEETAAVRDDATQMDEKTEQSESASAVIEPEATESVNAEENSEKVREDEESLPSAEPVERQETSEQDELSALLDAMDAQPKAQQPQKSGFQLDDDFISSFKGISFDD